MFSVRLPRVEAMLKVALEATMYVRIAYLGGAS